MSIHFYEIRNKANFVRDTDLKSVLRLNDAVQDKLDKAKWHTSQGIISVSGTKFMNWNQGIGGGGAIDLAIHLKNLSFIDAVEWLSDHFGTNGFHPAKIECRSKPNAFKLPLRDDSKLHRVKRYLVNSRCIIPALINSLIKSGKLYADIRANAVFLLLGKEKNIVGAELRGTTHLHWRGMAAGSNKSLGFFSIKNPSTKKIVLCESAIDTISCLIIHSSYSAISTSGANSNPFWLKSLISQGYDIYCGFDSDETGDTMSKKMISLYPTVKRLRPSKHDWNDLLISNSQI